MSTPSPLDTVKALSTPRKIFLAAAVLLLIDTFLPWYHASIGPISASLSGWHQLGTVAWVLLLALLIWEAARVTNMAPVSAGKADLYSSLLALAVVAVGAVFCIQRLADGSLGVGFWLGVVLLIALGVTAYRAFQASGGRDAVRREMDERRQAPPAA
jgi:hypothetical protein